MDFQVRISDPALADFEAILEYSWANFPATPESFGNSILNHLDLLKNFPYVGSPVASAPVSSCIRQS
ncbi:MAG: type II toxin-antitoxin system RelE/ParE family toxin [Acidobacteriota bacterium]|nr:type II toxin-antitoxin system RelE/ParE family toxin [Acidobacteriota bacterium]